MKCGTVTQARLGEERSNSLHDAIRCEVMGFQKLGNRNLYLFFLRDRTKIT